MKKHYILFSFVLFIVVLIVVSSFKKPLLATDVTGAWMLENSLQQQVLLFVDQYYTSTTYNKKDKRFIETNGGVFKTNDHTLLVTLEFDTNKKEKVGETIFYNYEVKGNQLTTNINGKTETWVRIDKANTNLAGVWHITQRMQDGTLTPIHQTGTRKTLKILSGTRFQWAAINPGTKEFMGTGGGTYTFENGKYTEHIEFFSRDSSRVGASLGFDGKLENGNWHHSGFSSKGDKIYEVWGRIK